MNFQFVASPSNTKLSQLTGIPCKFAMKCTRPECIFGHPSPMAPVTAAITKVTKLCRNDLQCSRPDCHFAHHSPASFHQQAALRHQQWVRNFEAFLTEENPKSEHNKAFNEYLAVFHPEARTSNALWLEIAKKLREEHRIRIEMDECLDAIDEINAARHANEVEDEFEDNQEENQELMDAFEDELIAEEIRNSFATC
jgi:hypothetical protein